MKHVTTLFPKIAARKGWQNSTDGVTRIEEQGAWRGSNVGTTRHGAFANMG
jgi:hypothetical protein